VFKKGLDHPLEYVKSGGGELLGLAMPASRLK
jgi:hypothetical protein